MDGTLRDCLRSRHAQGGRRSTHDKLRRALSRPSRFAPVMNELNRRNAFVSSIRSRLSAVPHRFAGFRRRSSSSRRTPALRLQPFADRNARALRKHTLHLAPFGAAVPVLAGRAAVMRLGHKSPMPCRTALITELRRLHFDVALQANRPRLARSLPMYRSPRFCSAATILSARQLMAFVAWRNTGQLGRS